MANEIIINGNKYEPYFEGVKLKEAWLNGERIWASVNNYTGVGSAIIENPSSNYYFDVYMSEDGWQTKQLILQNVNIIGNGSSSIKRIYKMNDGSILISAISSINNGYSILYQVDVESHTVTAIATHYILWNNTLNDMIDIFIPFSGADPSGSSKDSAIRQLQVIKWENGSSVVQEIASFSTYGVLTAYNGRAYYKYKSTLEYMDYTQPFSNGSYGTKITCPSLVMNSNPYGVSEYIYLGNNLVVGFYYGYLCYSSDGGTSFTSVKTGHGYSLHGITSYVKGKNIHVILSKALSGYNKGIYYSIDGITWNKAIDITNSYVENLSYDGERFYLYGYKYAYVSTDGINWTQTDSSTLFGSSYASKSISYMG